MNDLQDPEARAPRRLRRAEAVLAQRTERILLVLERCVDSQNHMAVLRTAELFGIQDIWTVDAQAGWRKPSEKVTRGSWRWLSNRHFELPEQAIEALRAEGRVIWATDLSDSAEELAISDLQLPERVALIIGRETDGVSPQMLAAADYRFYLPMVGFTSSFNLSVATALILQRMFDACPEARGDISETRKAELRRIWYPKLAKNPLRLREFLEYVDQPPPPLGDVRPPAAFRSSRTTKQIQRFNERREAEARERARRQRNTESH